jgi:hypothetical protein
MLGSEVFTQGLTSAACGVAFAQGGATVKYVVAHEIGQVALQAAEDKNGWKQDLVQTTGGKEVRA